MEAKIVKLAPKSFVLEVGGQQSRPYASEADLKKKFSEYTFAASKKEVKDEPSTSE